ncbi:unnamed protein product [Meganyctiphanes norvegica]|uniref:Uncharacterized protein n=1 Tax=Meganyctiphanes norvegica TaxID=48144 RepID=A0AAV2QL28_MEGNR
MFLNEDQVVRSIGAAAISSPTPSSQHLSTAASSPVDVGSLKHARRNLVQSFEGDHHLVPQTPITGKSYTIDRPASTGTPLAVVTSGLQKLYTLLAGRKNSPSPELLQLFKSCSNNPEESINTQISGLSESFCRLYTRSTEDFTGPSMEFAQLRTQMAQMLYYTFLEHILLDERKRGVHVEAILKEELFHRTLFTCCIEIVMRSYNDPRRFPWSLQVGNVEPYYFIRIIEPVIRSEKQSDNQLSRELVKHLKGIEEQILDSLAWRRDSPLWQLLTTKGCHVPSCADVNFSDQLETSDAYNASTTIAAATPFTLGLASSVMSPALKPLVNDKNPSSPVSTLNESFRSPIGQSSARRTLFPTPGTGGFGGGLSSALAFSRPSTLGSRLVTPNSAASTSATSPSNATQTGAAAALLTRSPTANKITLQVKENGVTTLYTLPSTATPLPASATITTTATPTTAVASTPQTTPASEAKTDNSTEATPNTEKKKEKPKCKGSLALFFRKFYTLANMRLRDLCDRLDITDTELRRKVWTCFEHSIIHYNNMMKDRHMDQMVMCAIYITCKVTGKDRIFQEIMKHYRNQPQAASHVYRSVLITRSTTTQPEGINNSTITPAGGNTLTSLPPPTPSQMTGTSSSFETEERGDLIKFYNHVYVQKIKTFALKFRGTLEGDQPPLSPLPVVRHTPVSPRRRISNNHSVFINSLSPMQGHTPLSPRRPLP